MIVAEMRYAGGFLWLFGTFALGGWAAVVFGHAERLSFAETLGVFGVVAVLGCAALVPFAKHAPRPGHTNARARFAPLAFTIAFLGVQIVILVREVSAHALVRDWQSLVVSTFVVVAFAISSVPDLRSRFGNGVEPSPRPNERQARLMAARAMPAGPAREAALRTFRMSGLVRIALIATLVVAMIALMPIVGPVLAFLIVSPTVAVAFVTLHRLYDL